MYITFLRFSFVIFFYMYFHYYNNAKNNNNSYILLLATKNVSHLSATRKSNVSHNIMHAKKIR